MKILFLVPYPSGVSPSQRFRFEQYFGILNAHGHTFYVQSFFSRTAWKIFMKPGRLPFKILLLLQGFLKRWAILLKVPGADFVFIHREATLVGPPLFEWIIARLFRKKIIFDFDDAIWLTDKKEEAAIFSWIRWRKKTAAICRWCYKVSAGNNYLCEYARKFNSSVVLNPTTIDLSHHKLLVPSKKNNTITIGWTGSRTTLKYLNQIQPVLSRLEQTFPQVQFLVIADERPDLHLERFIFLPWSKESEIEDLLRIDIGVMPLPDDNWTKGKCGFKLLQYLALEIPTVASDVGVNSDILGENVSGLLAHSEEDWYSHLEFLIKDEHARHELSRHSRKRIAEHYSVESNASNFLSLFE